MEIKEDEGTVIYRILLFYNLFSSEDMKKKKKNVSDFLLIFFLIL